MLKRLHTKKRMPPILVVSYEPMIRFLLAEALALEGYSPHVAADGEEGLKRLQQATEGNVVLLQVDPYSGHMAVAADAPGGCRVARSSPHYSRGQRVSIRRCPPGTAR